MFDVKSIEKEAQEELAKEMGNAIYQNLTALYFCGGTVSGALA